MDNVRNTDRSELPLLETALLWSMRAWVIGQNRNLNLTPRITKMFASLNASAAADRLDGFMSDLRAGAKRMVNIDCVCQPSVSADEILLLDIFALLQEAHEDEAGVLLGRNALGLSLSLNAAGHYLPRGPETVRRHAFCHLVSNHLLIQRSGVLN